MRYYTTQYLLDIFDSFRIISRTFLLFFLPIPQSHPFLCNAGSPYD
jgi:hypothetical protein